MTATWRRLPGLLLAGLVVAIPVLPLIGLAYSFTVAPGRSKAAAIFGSQDEPRGPAIDEWRALVVENDALGLIGTCLLLVVVVTAVALPLGLGLAWWEMRCRWVGRRVMAVLAILPLAMPSYLVATTIRIQGSAGGVGGAWFGWRRLEGFWPAALVLIVVTVPLVHLLLSAALARLSPAEDEAARLLGAGPWRRFRTAVLPGLRPALAFSLLLVALYVISDFGVVAVFAVPVPTWRLYQELDAGRMPAAAVVGATLLAVALPVMVAAALLHGRRQGAGVANPRASEARRLGWLGHGAAWLVHLLVIGVGVALPLLTLGQWVWDGLRRELAFASLWEPLRHSLYLAALGAGLAVALALVPAWQAARRRRSVGWILEQGVYLSSALPGVLLGFGLLLLSLMVARWSLWADWGITGRSVTDAMRTSGLLIALGYVMRFLAEAYAPIKSSVLRIDPRLEEGARMLGASSWRRWWTVIMPRLAPGVAAAVVLVVVAVIKELPITLILASAMGLKPLSFRIWDRYNEGFYHDAGATGLVVTALALAVVLLTLRWRRHAA